MASQIAFQDNVVIKIKTERDMPPSYCKGSHNGIVLDSPQLSGRVASTDRLHHTREQMNFQEETAQGREVMAEYILTTKTYT